MKIKSEFILKSVAGQHIVVPIGKEAAKFHGMITLNETGKFLFENLKTKQTLETLIDRLMDTYDVTKEQATKDVQSFVDILNKHNVLES